MKKKTKQKKQKQKKKWKKEKKERLYSNENGHFQNFIGH